MPRTARLDCPGLLQHVIVRGNERRVIFRDDADRRYLLSHLSSLLREAGTACYAWALMPNHLHLLLRRASLPLAVTMRRLLTGYAGHFNARHDRCGHLFQNRYKSIPVQEESHFLELIRYIHLNPLRGGVVSSLEKLDAYPWTGHASLIGMSSSAWQEIDGVLGLFSEDVVEARLLYRRFLADGEGVQPPPGYSDEGRPGRPRGSGNDRTSSPDAPLRPIAPARESRPDWEMDLAGRVSQVAFEELVQRVVTARSVERDELLGRCSRHDICQARYLLCCCAVRQAGLRGADLARILHLAPSAVSRMVRRGETLLRENPHFQAAIRGNV